MKHKERFRTKQFLIVNERRVDMPFFADLTRSTGGATAAKATEVAAATTATLVSMARCSRRLVAKVGVNLFVRWRLCLVATGRSVRDARMDIFKNIVVAGGRGWGEKATSAGMSVELVSLKLLMV